ncbi:hypothetical protein AOT82_2060 [Psychrobacter sp. AntiMn-1]|nr:hypothetical protein AOT82_2060 [Psychrobacter sp. AntiMn-1]
MGLWRLLFWHSSALFIESKSGMIQCKNRRLKVLKKYVLAKQ